jgi:hypothetical protein
MADWQPIETAPKDGQCILAIGGGVYDILSWENCCDDGEDDKLGWADHKYTIQTWPTHWMPLPDPPGEE